MVCQKIRELLKHPVSKYRSSEILFTDVIPKRDLLKNYEPDSKLSEDTTDSHKTTRQKRPQRYCTWAWLSGLLVYPDPISGAITHMF